MTVTEQPIGAVDALQSMERLEALAVCDVRVPVRAGSTAVAINSAPWGSTCADWEIVQDTIDGIVSTVTVADVTNTHSGTISGGGSMSDEILPYADFGTVTNAGTLIAPIALAIPDCTVLTLSDSGFFKSRTTGIIHSGTLEALTNFGAIQAGRSGICNGDHGHGIGSLSKSSMISGAASSLRNDAFIGNLTNSGIIQNADHSSSSGTRVMTTSTRTYDHTKADDEWVIGTLTNLGTITGPHDGIVNDGPSYATWMARRRRRSPQ